MRRIYPSTDDKYLGSTVPYETQRGQRYEVSIQQASLYATFDTHKEASQFLRQANIEHQLHIRNVLYYDEQADYYECELTGGKRVKFDATNLPIVESHLLYEDMGHCVTKINGHRITLASLLMPKPVKGKPRLVHKNGDLMDCRRTNLAWRSISRLRTELDPEYGVKRRESVLKTGTIQCRYVAQWRCPLTGKLSSRSFGYKYGDEAGAQAAKLAAIEAKRATLNL